MESYSPTYQAGGRQYRYNYSRERLEQLGKQSVVRTIRGRRVPVVEQQVISYTTLKADKFDRAPGYWVDLFDAALGRQA